MYIRVYHVLSQLYFIFYTIKYVCYECYGSRIFEIVIIIIILSYYMYDVNARFNLNKFNITREYSL